MNARKPPNSRRNLDIAIQRKYGYGESFVRARTAIANVVVAQMLPDCSIKGGSAIKLHFGGTATRFTTDLDIARKSDLDTFRGDLEASLRIGWGGFTGTLVAKESAAPQGVPSTYVMQPFDVKLAYRGSAWCTVPLEVGHNEIGDAEYPDRNLPEDVRKVFEDLGLPEPAPVPLMRLDYQVAQKLHAITTPNSQRVHDLIDLQIIVAESELNLASTRRVCERLFAYRDAQPWPSIVKLGNGWDVSYAERAKGLDVLPTASDAVAWTNNLIKDIESA